MGSQCGWQNLYFPPRQGVKWQDNKDFKPTRDLNADDVFSPSIEELLTRTIKFLAAANTLKGWAYRT